MMINDRSLIILSLFLSKKYLKSASTLMNFHFVLGIVIIILHHAKKTQNTFCFVFPCLNFALQLIPQLPPKLTPHFPRTHSCVIMKSVHVPYSAHVPCEITVQRHRKMHVKTSYANTALYANTNTTQRSAERMHVGVRDDLIVLMRRSAPIETIVDPDCVT